MPASEQYGYWLGRIESALGIYGSADPEITLSRVEKLAALEKAVILNRQEATALAAWGGATRESYREAALRWDRRIDAIMGGQDDGGKDEQ